MCGNDLGRMGVDAAFNQVREGSACSCRMDGEGNSERPLLTSEAIKKSEKYVLSDFQDPINVDLE